MDTLEMDNRIMNIRIIQEFTIVILKKNKKDNFTIRSLRF